MPDEQNDPAQCHANSGKPLTPPAYALAILPISKGASEFGVSNQLCAPQRRAFAERQGSHQKKYRGGHQRNERIDDADADTREAQNPPDHRWHYGHGVSEASAVARSPRREIFR